MEKKHNNQHRPHQSQMREKVAGPLISWKSIFAGFIVSLITYLTLTALGAGVGGASASGMIQEGGDPSKFAAGAGLWLGISALLALFAGCYFTARISPFITNRIGGAQGLVISSLFFAFLFYGAGSTIGAAGKGLGSMFSAIGHGAGDVSKNPAVQNTIHKAFANTNLKSEPQVVAQNLAAFLLSGDAEGAKSYLSYQTSLSGPELDARYASLKTEFEARATEAGVIAAKAVSATGWTMFITLLAGLASGFFGGALGARANFNQPIAADYRGRNLATSPA